MTLTRPDRDGCGTRPGDPGILEEPDWVTALRDDGPVRDEALRQLHALLVRAARHQVGRMGGMLAGGRGAAEEVVICAADEAMVMLLAKLESFEGRSRFTTWAYKFAIYEAANEVRRRAWSSREVRLEDEASWCDTSAGPEQQAEASDLAAEVGRGLAVALTTYQRRIAVALLVDHVPIDVLAERLGTNRGALYKTLHVARSRLRAHLVASGHLPAHPAQGADS